MRCSAPAASSPTWVLQSSSGPSPAAYITLGKPLNSNYTNPKRAPSPEPSEETTVFPLSSSGAHSATRPRDEQRTQSVQSRADHYGPTSASTSSQQAPCEGCGRKGHTPDNCDRKEHPNWNPAHGHVLFADTSAGRVIAQEARGTYLSSLLPLGLSGIPSHSSGRSAKHSMSGAARSSAHAQGRQHAQSPPRQPVPIIGPLPNLPASHRGLLP
jgi:hypothetical protein